MTSVAISGSGLLADRVARDLAESGIDISQENADWLVSVSGSSDEQLKVAEAACTRGGKVLSLATDPETIDGLLELDPLAREGGASIIAGAGWTPGLTGWLASRTEVGAVERIEVSWVVSTSGIGAQVLSSHAVASGTGSAVAFRDGAWRRESAGTDEKAVFFPEPVGWQEVKVVAGAEASLFPKTLAVGGSVVTRGGFVSRGAAWLSRRVTDPAPLSPSVRRLATVAGRLLPMVERLGSSSGGWCAVRVDVSGSDGSHVLAVVDQPVNLASIPVVAALVSLASSDVPSGAHLCAQVVDANTGLRECARRGLRPARLDR